MNAATHLPPLEGLGHELLLEWGRWYRDDREGRASWAAKPRVDPGFYGTPPERARFVDKLIAKHKLKYRDDWRVVARYYLDDLAEWQIALQMRNPDGTKWAEGRVRTLLLVVCGMVEREYRDWRNT